MLLAVVAIAGAALFAPRRPSSGAIALLLLGAWALVSLAWSSAPAPAAAGLWIAGAGLALALGSFERRRDAAELGASAIATVSSLAVIAQALSGARGLGLHGGHGNPNWLGLVVAAALPLVAGRLARRWKSGERWALLACAAASLAALSLAGSSTAWLALAGAALLLPGRLKALALVGALPLALRPEALAGRVWIWRGSLDAALAGLPLGHGAGGFPSAYLEAQGALLRALPLEEASLRFANAGSAHQDYLQILTEQGPLGLALALAVLAVPIATLRRRFPGGAAAAAVVAISALGDAPLEQPAVIALLAMVLGCTPPLPKSARALRWLSLAALACVLPLALRAWLSARITTAAADAGIDQRIALLERATTLDPLSTRARIELGLARLERGDASGALADLERAGVADVGTQVALGNAHAQLGADDQAIAAYRRALAYHPALFRAHANLAELLRRQGALEQAARHLEAATSLQPHHPKVVHIAEALRRDRIDAATR